MKNHLISLFFLVNSYIKKFLNLKMKTFSLDCMRKFFIKNWISNKPSNSPLDTVIQKMLLKCMASRNCKFEKLMYSISSKWCFIEEIIIYKQKIMKKKIIILPTFFFKVSFQFFIFKKVCMCKSFNLPLS